MRPFLPLSNNDMMLIFQYWEKNFIPHVSTWLMNITSIHHRYELHFLVADAHWGQTDVAANMTVEVRHLSPESLAHAVPITLTPTSPAALAAAWSPMVSCHTPFCINVLFAPSETKCSRFTHCFR